MILDDDEALAIVKKFQKTPDFIIKSRKESKELFALIEGDNFLEELIHRIEHIESEERQEARKKYSRDIAHFFERLLRPVDNVYSATGGSKIYDLKGKKLADLLTKIGRIRSGKNLQEWLKANWMPLYHSDPNGVIFLEYTTKGDNPRCWPTYKNIENIRSYIPKGQLVDWILFEPVKGIKAGSTVMLWRLVDDLNDRIYVQDGENFTLDEQLSFEHPFGQTPALINSDIEKLKHNHRLSPIDKVVEVSREYARDQSIKTIYKKYHGFPILWKYENQCQNCMGAKKVENAKGVFGKCPNCDGHGYYKSKDVTDVTALKAPETKEDVRLDPVAGYITPPLEIWKQYNEELEVLDKLAHKTHWGTMTGVEQSISKTATEIIMNSQPMIDRLDEYSNVAEMMEGKLTEWIANFTDPSKDKDKRVASINYGRRYIIDPPDAILEKYEKAREAGDNNVILDRLLNEYFTAKYKNDPEWLRIILLKSDVEPYIHITIEQVNEIFGRIEAQRKVLFESWWNTLASEDMKKTSEQLIKEFDTWFDSQKKTDPTGGEEE